MNRPPKNRPPGNRIGRFAGIAGMLCLPPLLLLSCGESELPAPLPPAAELIVAAYGNDAEALRRGQSLFLGSCVDFCHNLIEEEADLAGALFLFDCEWIHADGDADIYHVIKEGIPDTRMVGFGDNFPEGDSDVWKIIAYIRHSQDNCAAD